MTKEEPRKWREATNTGKTAEKKKQHTENYSMKQWRTGKPKTGHMKY